MSIDDKEEGIYQLFIILIGVGFCAGEGVNLLVVTGEGVVEGLHQGRMGEQSADHGAEVLERLSEEEDDFCLLREIVMLISTPIILFNAVDEEREVSF